MSTRLDSQVSLGTKGLEQTHKVSAGLSWLKGHRDFAPPGPRSPEEGTEVHTREQKYLQMSEIPEHDFLGLIDLVGLVTLRQVTWTRTISSNQVDWGTCTVVGPHWSTPVHTGPHRWCSAFRALSPACLCLSAALLHGGYGTPTTQHIRDHPKEPLTT